VAASVGRRRPAALLVTAMRACRTDGMEYAEIGVDTADPSGAHGPCTSLGYEVFHDEVMLTIEL
jgi:mycothiol synthase